MKHEELTASYNAHDHEEDIYRLWETSGFFNPDNLPDTQNKKPFTIMMAPPNVTGHIHVGHALENILSDILIRRKRMEGFKTLFLPGKDHAGIAGQFVVEKALKKEGRRRQDLGREKFLQRVWEWMNEYGSNIDQELKRLGLSTDWSRARFTMDERYQQAVENVFIHYHKKGYIYRGKRVVNWCARCFTSISDLEVEYREENGNLYHIKYGPLILATSRPETKLGDTALAVNPNDTRYKEYIGKELTIQSIDSSIPRTKKPKLKDVHLSIVADSAADPEFGTGIIKVTPAHDTTDFEIYERHQEIPIIKIIDETGRMNKNAGLRFEGLTVKEAREQMIQDLQALKLMEKIEDYQHSVAYCSRCESVIEPLLSLQWFVSMKELALNTEGVIKKNKIDFVPENRKEMMLEWINNIKDWNISRQLWWGHRIPAWHCNCDEGEKWHIGNSAPNSKCKKCKKDWEQSTDVLDTWFSSALWPFVTLGWPEKTQDLSAFYPTALISSAREIFFIWIFRMIASGIEFINNVPFKTVFVHPTVLDKQGRKMSKSKGNVVDPMKIIDEYGIDATRFGITWQAMSTQDIQWSEDGFRAGKKFLNKLWNSGRFVFKHIGERERPLKRPKPKTKEGETILTTFDSVEKQVASHFDKFEFGASLHLLYEFYWHEFCDIYLEQAKKDSSQETKQILFYIFANSLKLLHPFIPFITELLWRHLPLENKNILAIESIS